MAVNTIQRANRLIKYAKNGISDAIEYENCVRDARQIDWDELFYNNPELFAETQHALNVLKIR